jgi:hypothetical protein
MRLPAIDGLEARRDGERKAPTLHEKRKGGQYPSYLTGRNLCTRSPAKTSPV